VKSNRTFLLYYQAELIYLRKKLHEVEWRDFRTPGTENTSKYADNLEFLIEDREEYLESQETEEKELLQAEAKVLMERIRTTLEKYSKPLKNVEEKCD
jgi:hypothetical protein